MINYVRRAENCPYCGKPYELIPGTKMCKYCKKLIPVF